MATIEDDIGYTALQAELGGAIPDGSGVAAGQVEGAVNVGGQMTWMPELTNGEFVGKTITNESGAPAGISSGHATAVAKLFYGSISGMARGITSISSYGADPWLGANFLWVTGVRRPASAASRVVNHSWVGDASSANAESLRRLDWVIETDEMLHVTGLANGAGGGPTNIPLLAGAFNAIAPGITSGAHLIGTVAVDADYVAGRVRPDLVVPEINTSLSAARTSSAAAVLVETGHATAALSTDPVTTSFTNRAGAVVRNAERSEIIKAALMAGADRITRNSTDSNLALYRGSAGYRAANGLDTRYGAGQLNIRNSHHIIAAGEQNSAEDGGPGSGSASRGFDYDPVFGGSSGSNIVANYALPTAATPQLLTAALVTNIDINGGTQNYFNGTASFRDLSLSVIDVSSGNPVATSQSTIDNTEHAWLVVPANAQYALRVARVGTTAFTHDYGLAWQLMPDADADGAHNGQDNCIASANGPLLLDAGGQSQLDSDGDGYGNACDGDLNNSGGFVNFADLAAFRAAFGTTSAGADLNGSGGIVNYSDLAAFRALFGFAPGPSAFVP